MCLLAACCLNSCHGRAQRAVLARCQGIAEVHWWCQQQAEAAPGQGAPRIRVHSQIISNTDCAKQRKQQTAPCTVCMHPGFSMRHTAARDSSITPGTTAVTYQPQDTDSDEAWLRTDIPDPRQKHSNIRTPAVLLNGPAYPLDTHTQPPHKRPCTSQNICATPEPQSNTVPDGHPTDPSNDAEANGDSSLRRVSGPPPFFFFGGFSTALQQSIVQLVSTYKL